MIVIFAKLAMVDGQLLKSSPLHKTQTNQKLIYILGILTGFIRNLYPSRSTPVRRHGDSNNIPLWGLRFESKNRFLSGLIWWCPSPSIPARGHGDSNIIPSRGLRFESKNRLDWRSFVPLAQHPATGPGSGP